MRKRSLSWIKKLTQEDIIIKKEPPRRNKSVKGGDKPGERVSHRSKKLYGRK